MLRLAALALLHKALLCVCLSLCDTFDSSSELVASYPWSRFLVWDGVHFASNALNNGPLYEHQYAFWSLWPRLAAFARPFGMPGVILALVAGSTICHILATVVLATWTIPALNSSIDAVQAAKIYILCPAGIFLVMGYSESAFALVSFIGLSLYYRGWTLAASVVFAISCHLRSNGLLWGLVYLTDLLTDLWRSFFARDLMSQLRSIRWKLIPGGLLIGFSWAIIQMDLNQKLCPGRPWCNDSIPLAYSWIQNHYWGVGFLQYWQVAQLPNFAFALPTFILLARSLKVVPPGVRVVQVALFLGALLFWNVQIVTRLASCTPGPAMYVADLARERPRERAIWLTYFAVWGCVQAGLFGAFLPPA